MKFRAQMMPLLFTSVFTATALPGLAGTAVVTSSDGNESTFEYDSGLLRMSSGSESAYAVIRDNTFYTVMRENGQAMVFDAGSMMRGMGKAAAQQLPTDINVNVLSLQKTGRSETVAGIPGEVYELRFKDENGKTQNEELVLSTDPRAKEFRDALFLMLNIAAKLVPGESVDSGRDIQQRLSKLDAGVLRYGQEMAISRIDDNKVDPARFELPAPPMNMQGLGDLFKGMTQGRN